MSSSMVIERLILVGSRKLYITKFHRGLNIIYGDSGTGKSGILDLIDYMLGASSFPMYPEIESTARYLAMEIWLNGTMYTIRREVFSPQALIEVYPCRFDQVDQYPCKRYIPKYGVAPDSDEYGIYSQFLFEALNFQSVKIKVSPSKADSTFARLSFRDLFKYCYINQDDLGSKYFMDAQNPSVAVKNTQVFKYIFNILDEQITEIEQQISSLANEKKNAEAKYKFVVEFLREAEFQSNFESIDDLSALKEEIQAIQLHIIEINNRISGDNDIYRAAQVVTSELATQKKMAEAERQDILESIEKFVRLKNDYILDLQKYKATEIAKKKIGEAPQGLFQCPICSSQVPYTGITNQFENPDESSIQQEVASIRKRVRDIESFIVSSRERISQISHEIDDLNRKHVDAMDSVNKMISEAVAPYLAERDAFISKLGALEQEYKNVLEKQKIQNMKAVLFNKSQTIESAIAQLNEKLKGLREHSPSISESISRVSENLADFLKHVKINTPINIYADSRFHLPVVRDVEYKNIRSGGLRTLSCIGYACSFLKIALDSEINHPAFIMIDTIGKYLGKVKEQYASETSSTHDVEEGVADPAKYQNIFSYLINLSDSYRKIDRSCQIIIVDNDIPQNMTEELSAYVVAHFNSAGEQGLPVGYIDDARN